MQIFLLAFLLISFNGYASQAEVSRTHRVEDRVKVHPRRVVVVRNRAIAKQFPGREKAVVTYPVVTGLSNPAVLRRVRSALQLKNIFGYSLADYRDDSWLSEFGYTVNHNGNHLLDITFTQSGLAAYPDEHQKHLLINLLDGNIVKAADVFDSKKLESLAALVDSELQREIKQLESENASTSTAPDEREAVSGAYDNLKFEVQNLDEFSVGIKGVTFLYDAGFPHVIKALEPQGRYFFSYSQLGSYLRPDGLLARFKHSGKL